MNAKHLPLKFAMVAVAVAICIGLLSTQGLQQGIDLRGGHSLIFEIRSNEMELERLSEQRQSLRVALRQAEQADDAEQAEKLRRDVERIEADIEHLERAPAAAGRTEDMIAVIKGRLDPQGLAGVEVRPVGSNRIEVRIPAAGKETQQAKSAYQAALEDLERGNLTQGDLRRLVETYRRVGDMDALSDRVRELAHGNADQIARIETVLTTYDEIVAAQRAIKAVETKASIANKAARLLAAVTKAQTDLTEARRRHADAAEALNAAQQDLAALGPGEPTDAPGELAEQLAEARAAVERQQATLRGAEEALDQATGDLEAATEAVTAGAAFVVAHDRLQAAREAGDADAVADAQETYDDAVEAIRGLLAVDAAARQADAADADAQADAAAALEAARQRAAKRIEAVADLAAGADLSALADQANDIAAQRDKAVGTAGKALDKAQDAHATARQAAVELGSVRQAELERDVLSFYVPPREAEASSGESHERAVAQKMETFRTAKRELLQAHPARREQIEKVIAAYTAWMDLRRPLDDPEDVKRIIAKAGVLEFRIVPSLPGGGAYTIDPDTFRRYRRLLEQEGPEEVRKRDEQFIWLPLSGERGDHFGGLPVIRNWGEQYAHADGKWYILCCNTEPLTMLHEKPPGGWTLTDAYPTSDDMGRPAVGFEFDARGAKLFAQLTSAHTGKPMAVMVDDVVYSAPVIQSTISSKGIITGQFTRTKTEQLARTLQAGSLPARLNSDPVAENTFGPSIGQVNRERGFRAAIWGLILVAGFMLIYYMLAGLLADVALLLNIILVLGAMSALSTVFTLPGIAGVILTIGIAVDANVLIFERLREEQAKGQSVRMTLTNAYQRAFSAIFDANVTTLITCLILAWVGSEEVRGFAITLGFGVVFSLFTTLVVTRWLFQFLLDRRWVKRPVFMLSILGTPKVNWMKKRHLFWGLSVALMVMGIASLLWQKGDILGIEFSSGTQYVVQLKDGALLTDPDSGERVLPDDAVVRRLYVAEARTQGHDKLAETARVETRIDPDRLKAYLAAYDDNGDERIAADEAPGTQEYFRLLDSNGDGALSRGELNENLPHKDYQISTTVTDVDTVRAPATAFGDALETRRPRTFAALSGTARRLGVSLGAADRGMRRIDETLVSKADAAFRPELESFKGGALYAFESVAPAITPREMAARISDMRRQIDFSDHRFARTKVIPLDDAVDDAHTALAVLVKPAEPVSRARLDDWTAKEHDLLTAAFSRSEAGETRNFDAAIAGEMAQRAILAVVLSWLAIVGYLWFRFGSVRWGLAAVVCLIHDVVIVVGMVAASGWLYKTWLGDAVGLSSFKIDLAMIAAILTVIGYSVNDTIVVFDRIRENRGKLTTVSSEVINRSINQTLSRTLLTSGTTFLVVVIMYAFGGEGIHAFSFALLVGVIFGTYSSIAVASPLLMGLKKALVARTVGEPGAEPAS